MHLEDLSSDEDGLPDGDDGFAYQSNDECVKPPIKQELLDDRPESPVSSLSSQNLSPIQMIDIEDLLLPPGRYQRPLRICFLIRGLPGSGKSHLARLIKNKEQSFGQSPRVLSLDDYFLVDKEEEEKDPVTGRITKLTRSVYEFDAEMEDVYVQNLLKAFKRTISERLFDFVIVDCCNHRLETYCEFHNYARSNGFKVRLLLHVGLGGERVSVSLCALFLDNVVPFLRCTRARCKRMSKIVPGKIFTIERRRRFKRTPTIGPWLRTITCR